MRRNLDLTALRSFAMVAETGGVTRAATRLHLTQSAVSMQLKRLEDAIGQSLLDRSGRGVALTGQGELLLSYAKRMIALNDEAWGRMTGQAYEGEVVLGVPSDIVYPTIPAALQRIAREYPRVKLTLISSYTRRLKDQLAKGAADVILTTESVCEQGGETLARSGLVWVGAPGGHAWRSRPLRLAFENNCIFRAPVQQALDAAGIEWDMAVSSDSTRTIEATVSADLAVHASIGANIPPHFEEIRHGGALPELQDTLINLYVAETPNPALTERIAAVVRDAFLGSQTALAAE